MADKCHKCLLGLIILCSFLTGTSGAEVTHIFSTSGENVRLPCKNALSDCTSTIWNYDRLTYLETVDLIVKGKMKNNRERHERLSLGSDCSLNIKKVTKQDYGIYICQQYGQQGSERHVYLHVLHVSSSSSQTEIRSGSSVTLSCQLYSYDRFPCDILVRTEGVQLIWVNQAGVNLQTDSRYQISFSSGQCNSTLTTTLLNEDHNREWRCLITQRNEVKTSATYTVKYTTPTRTKTLTPFTSSKTPVKTPAAPTQAVTTVIPVHIINSEDPKTRITPESPEVVSPLVVVMLVIFPALAVLIPAVMLWVIYTTKADTKEVIDSDVLTYVTYSGIAAENLSKRIMGVNTVHSQSIDTPNQKKRPEGYSF